MNNQCRPTWCRINIAANVKVNAVKVNAYKMISDKKLPYSEFTKTQDLGLFLHKQRKNDFQHQTLIEPCTHAENRKMTLSQM